jgi:hypothetical protein
VVPDRFLALVVTIAVPDGSLDQLQGHGRDNALQIMMEGVRDTLEGDLPEAKVLHSHAYIDDGYENIMAAMAKVAKKWGAG